MGDDRIELIEYNPGWPQMAWDEMAHLKEILPAEHILDMQHVGSTAIPGMVAKPIIDIQIAVDSLEAAKLFAVKTLEANDYVYWYNNPDPDRMFFVKGMPPYGKKRTHHVHMCETSCSQWAGKIFFRDYLIEHPEAAQEYAALKRKLAAEYTHQREEYTDAKEAFINKILSNKG